MSKLQYKSGRLNVMGNEKKLSRRRIPGTANFCRFPRENTDTTFMIREIAAEIQ